MKPIIIKNSRIPGWLSFFLDIYAITLFPFIFIRDEGNSVTITHESIHIRQQLELLIIFFYLLYLGYWIRGLISGMTSKEAYLAIPFEREAYGNQKKEGYLDSRKPFSWLDYLEKD